MRATQRWGAFCLFDLLHRTIYMHHIERGEAIGPFFLFMELPMFWRLFSRRTYNWHPAVDMRDGRIAATLMTFSSN